MSKDHPPVSPTISFDEFSSLGFDRVQYMPDPPGVWSMTYRKDLNPFYHYDHLEVKWFCGTQRYSIWRQTKHLMNIPCFEGFLNSIDDLKWILDHIDYHKFYLPCKTGN